jgi:predicted CXXCH cytochrome family protein
VDGTRPADAQPGGTSLYRADWEASVHAGLECTDCHAGVTTAEHATPLPPADCSGCHGDAVQSYLSGPHGLHAAAGDSLAPRCATCHDPHTVRPSSDAGSVLHRSRVAQVCTRCHADGSTVGARPTAVPLPGVAYAAGAHAEATAAGNLKAATCGDCHDSHGVLRAQDDGSPVHPGRIPETCGKCHTEAKEAFVASVHGQAAARSAMGAPVCNDCHGEHAVLRLRADTGVKRVIANETCESCHANPALARRYGLPVEAVASYEDSYHGRATRGGLAQAAGCTSCHGVHRILRRSDPESSIHPANLQQTCLQCHPNATAEFASSYAHSPDRATASTRGVGWVRAIYIGLIVGVIGGMLVHNGILWLHDVRREYREHRARATHVRFTRGEVRQHGVLLVTFTLLVITGFALKYRDSSWVQVLGAVGFDEELRRLVHRIAAVVFVALSLVHGIYLGTRRGREQLRHIRPEMRDLREAVANVAYHLGRAAAPPRFGRFRYIEKAEYWALVWGTVVMVATGFILWFPETLRGPEWLVRVSEAIHLYEAWLAFLAIVVWHFFFVLVRPGVRGTFTAWTGRMEPDHLQHEHPEEYARTEGARPSRAKVQPEAVDAAGAPGGPGTPGEPEPGGSGPEVAAAGAPDPPSGSRRTH